MTMVARTLFETRGGRLAGLLVSAVLASGLCGSARAETDDAPAKPPKQAETGPQPRSCPSGSLRLEPGMAIQPRVAAAPEGAVFCFTAGVYRGQTISPKSGQQFIGEQGAILSGAVVLDGLRREGRFWAADGQMQSFRRIGQCRKDEPACDRPEAVFVDGQPLREVMDESELVAGTFVFDHDRHRIVMFDDPTGHTVETSVVSHAFMANSARDVVVSNLVIENYASPAQLGALFNDSDPLATGWRLEHNEVRYNSGLGVLASGNGTIRANYIHHNGQLGVSFSLDNVVLEDNIISNNNIGGFDPGWEGGGVKGAVAHNVVMRRNWVHDNKGPGLWCDIECQNIVYENNLVENNENAGIFHEISYAAKIRGNTVRFNGEAVPSWFWGGNILVAASTGVEIEDNNVSVRDDGTGIALVDQGRTREKGGFYETRNNLVKGNTIRFFGHFARMGGASDVDAGHPNMGVIERGHNRFEDNTYLVPKGTDVEFTWGEKDYDFAAFQGLGQDRTSRLIPESAATAP